LSSAAADNLELQRTIFISPLQRFVSSAPAVNFGKIKLMSGTDFKTLKKLVDRVDTYPNHKNEKNFRLTLANKSQLRSSLTICLKDYD
jgi:hypothetical protein